MNQRVAIATRLGVLVLLAATLGVLAFTASQLDDTRRDLSITQHKLTSQIEQTKTAQKQADVCKKSTQNLLTVGQGLESSFKDLATAFSELDPTAINKAVDEYTAADGSYDASLSQACLGATS